MAGNGTSTAPSRVQKRGTHGARKPNQQVPTHRVGDDTPINKKTLLNCISKVASAQFSQLRDVPYAVGLLREKIEELDRNKSLERTECNGTNSTNSTNSTNAGTGADYGIAPPTPKISGISGSASSSTSRALSITSLSLSYKKMSRTSIKSSNCSCFQKSIELTRSKKSSKLFLIPKLIENGHLNCGAWEADFAQLS
jgi:hypothetical protein